MSELGCIQFLWMEDPQTCWWFTWGLYSYSYRTELYCTVGVFLEGLHRNILPGRSRSVCIHCEKCDSDHEIRYRKQAHLEGCPWSGILPPHSKKRTPWRLDPENKPWWQMIATIQPYGLFHPDPKLGICLRFHRPRPFPGSEKLVNRLDPMSKAWSMICKYL